MKLAAPVFLFALLAGCASQQARPPVSAAPDRADWRWVQGAVFVPTSAVNEAQQWDEYDPVVNERELHYASVYGINLVRVYLHYDIYLKKREALLSDISDFLASADAHGIKVEFVFFDDCWNQPPRDILSADYRYPAPLRGVHNSQWLVSPGEDVQSHYAQHRERLKAYVQDIVRAHRDDPRIAFWEIYNEPSKADSTVRLERDAAAWIKETATSIPATATGREFSGGPYSDFPSWHQYGSYAIGGDAHSLCSECMNRQGQDVPGIVAHYRGKVGYVFWEFGIGRDNCRFAWSENREKPRPDETPTPFHGIVYPDGHPWSLADARALLGDARFERTAFFEARYYRDPGFSQLAKTSVTPFVDFDLVDEDGVGSPDASAGVPRRRFSVEYSAGVTAPASGVYTFSVKSDGDATLLVDGRAVASAAAPGSVSLGAGGTHTVLVRYAHGEGRSSLHVRWSGPGFADTILLPSTHPAGL